MGLILRKLQGSKIAVAFSLPQ